MEITGIKAGHLAAGKTSSKKDWKLSDSLREKITEYAREGAEQNVYMGNKFLALRKSEVAKVAPQEICLADVSSRTLYAFFRSVLFSAHGRNGDRSGTVL